MKLIYKLFTSFLLTSLMIIILMIGIMQYFASRHFDDYVVRVEMERMGDVMEALKTEYKTHQGWGHLEQNRFLWDRMRRSQGPFEEGAPPPLPPVPGPDGLERQRSGPQGPQSPQGLGGRQPLPPMPMLLYNEGKRLIFGHPDNFRDQTLHEIQVDGKTVGWLGFSRPGNMKGPLELQFLYEQTQAFLIVGCGTLVLAALVSFFLSRHLLRPIRQLMTGARALASRKFETRVSVRSSDELGDLAADFNTMANTLEKYEYLRRQWMSDIAHELRTPLAVLRGEIEAVLDGVRDVRKGTLESLHAEVMLLGKIVNDLHTLTVIESDALLMTKAPLEVLPIVAAILGAFRPRFEENDIEVAHDLDVLKAPGHTIMGDPDRLGQVFSNVFENSLRYTDAPGKVRFRHDQKADVLYLFIEDSAPGVSDSALPFIFDRLFRVDPSRSRKKGGSGLGLAISKAIVEAHGGRISASQSSLGGLRIEIILPLVKER